MLNTEIGHLEKICLFSAHNLIRGIETRDHQTLALLTSFQACHDKEIKSELIL